MIAPTNEQINRLCAEACGYHLCSGYGGQQTGISELPGGGGKVRPIPLYCEDRNALPELIQAVKNAGFLLCFVNALWTKDSDSLNHTIAGWKLLICETLMMPPRTVCIAALKALSKWPAGWSTEEPTE